MPKILFSMSTLLFIVFLASCQSLSKDECRAADWRVIGENDGAQGKDPQKRFGKHVKACERVNVVPDQNLWHQGYQIGLVRYCTPLSGLGAGQAGKTYHNVCPPDRSQGFITGYQLGYSEYTAKSDISSLERRISSAEYNIKEHENTISEGKGDEDSLRSMIRTERDDIRSFNRDIGRNEADLGRIQRDIEFFRNNPPATIINSEGY